MADIQLRFNRDMLTVTAPVKAELARRGVTDEADVQFMNLIEPDSIAELYRMEMVAGTPCLATNTEGITPARLAHHGLEGRGLEIATAALTVAKAAKPQHILAEIGPCGLPMDASLASSLKEHCNQYVRVASYFRESDLDAWFLSGFDSIDELKCAIIGLRKVSLLPIIASVRVDTDGHIGHTSATIEEAATMIAEYEGDVVGIETAAGISEASALVQRAAAACAIPILVQLDVVEVNAKQGESTRKNPYFCPETMLEAGAALRRAGAQFVRAGGAATPAYTGVLAATLTGLDVLV